MEISVIDIQSDPKLSKKKVGSLDYEFKNCFFNNSI